MRCERQNPSRLAVAVHQKINLDASPLHSSNSFLHVKQGTIAALKEECPTIIEVKAEEIMPTIRRNIEQQSIKGRIAI